MNQRRGGDSTLDSTESTDATLIALVRHGETEWTATGRVQGHNDVPLNADGRRQADELGRRLALEEWDALYTSPLARARQTAAAIAAHTGLSPAIERDLVERDFGALAGLTWQERQQRAATGEAETDIPGLESRRDLERRALAALQAIARRHPGGRVIAVSHGALISAVVRAAARAAARAATPPAGSRAEGQDALLVPTASIQLVKCRGSVVRLPPPTAEGPAVT